MTGFYGSLVYTRAPTNIDKDFNKYAVFRASASSFYVVSYLYRTRILEVDLGEGKEP